MNNEYVLAPKKFWDEMDRAHVISSDNPFLETHWGIKQAYDSEECEEVIKARVKLMQEYDLKLLHSHKKLTHYNSFVVIAKNTYPRWITSILYPIDKKMSAIYYPEIYSINSTSKYVILVHIINFWYYTSRKEYDDKISAIEYINKIGFKKYDDLFESSYISYILVCDYKYFQSLDKIFKTCLLPDHYYCPICIYPYVPDKSYIKRHMKSKGHEKTLELYYEKV